MTVDETHAMRPGTIASMLGLPTLDSSDVEAPVLLDLETVALDLADEYVPPVDLTNISAPSNYKKQEAIDDYIARERAKRIEDRAQEVARGALDPDLCRIVALGYMRPDDDDVTTATCEDEAGEREALQYFWSQFGRARFIGFNVVSFDFPALLRRSRLLGLRPPLIGLSKYRHPAIVDLMRLLNFDGLLPWRSQAFYVKRFGLAVPTHGTTGADIAGLVAAGDWAAVREHCRCDVLGARALAQWLGVI